MKRFISLALTLALCMGLFTGCGSSSSDRAPQEMGPAMDSYEENMMDVPAAGETDVYEPQDNRKIIYNADVDLESKEFDKAHEALLKAASDAKAYVQNSEEGGQAEWGSRWVRYTFRVPSENYRAFLTGAESSGNMLRKQESTEDVTAEYVDVEARLTSLTNQENRLMELSAQAESLEDLLAIENQLSNVRYQIESYTGQKRVMDNLITYSTVNVNLNEVESLTPIDDSFATRLKDAFHGSWVKFVEGLQNFAIAVVYMLPELLVLAAIIAVVVVILRASAKRRAEKAKNAPKSAAPSQDHTVNNHAAAADGETKQPASYERQDK